MRWRRSAKRLFLRAKNHDPALANLCEEAATLAGAHAPQLHGWGRARASIKEQGPLLLVAALFGCYAICFAYSLVM